MRASVTVLTLLSFLSSIGSALASPTTDCLSEYCPTHLEPRATLPAPLPASIPVTLPAALPTPTSPLTNGQRMARGLPPNPPSRRSRNIIHSRIAARQAAPSPLPCDKKRGVIKVVHADSGKCLGYISRNSYDHAQYRYQHHRDNALVVEFSVDFGVKSVCDVVIKSQNSDTPDFPLLALIQGRDNFNADLSQGSYHYTYIGGMAEPGSPPGSIPLVSPANTYSIVTGLTRGAESDVWSFDLHSNELKPHWTNWDGSRPNIHSFSQVDALYVGGDTFAFNKKYPAPVNPITFLFVSI